VFATLGLTWQPFGGAGYFVLIVLLIFSALAAMVLIVVPLVKPHSKALQVRVPADGPPRGRVGREGTEVRPWTSLTSACWASASCVWRFR
jgi:hypothetical protein